MMEYLLQKPPVPVKQATICLIRIKTCNALLRMLVACIRSYLKTALKCKFLNLMCG